MSIHPFGHSIDFLVSRRRFSEGVGRVRSGKMMLFRTKCRSFEQNAGPSTSLRFAQDGTFYLLSVRPIPQVRVIDQHLGADDVDEAEEEEGGEEVEHPVFAKVGAAGEELK
jgi:hypothetical protein